MNSVNYVLTLKCKPCPDFTPVSSNQYPVSPYADATGQASTQSPVNQSTNQPVSSHQQTWPLFLSRDVSRRNNDRRSDHGLTSSAIKDYYEKMLTLREDATKRKQAEIIRRQIEIMEALSKRETVPIFDGNSFEEWEGNLDSNHKYH